MSISIAVVVSNKEKRQINHKEIIEKLKQLDIQLEKKRGGKLE